MLMQPLLVGISCYNYSRILPLNIFLCFCRQKCLIFLVEQTISGVASKELFAYLAAVSCAERGHRSHLLLRGEQPEILTGYNLISTVYGNVTYVPRSRYADREKMLNSHANMVAGNRGYVVGFNEIFETSFTTQISSASNFVQMDADRSAENCPKKVVIVNEGAGDAVAILGKSSRFMDKA